MNIQNLFVVLAAVLSVYAVLLVRRAELRKLRGKASSQEICVEQTSPVLWAEFNDYYVKMLGRPLTIYESMQFKVTRLEYRPVEGLLATCSTDGPSGKEFVVNVVWLTFIPNYMKGRPM